MKPPERVRATPDQARTTLFVLGALTLGLAGLSLVQIPDDPAGVGGERVLLWGPVAVAYLVTGSKWIAGGLFAAVGSILLLLAGARPHRKPVGDYPRPAGRTGA
jgi:hypothetical protein